MGRQIVLFLPSSSTIETNDLCCPKSRELIKGFPLASLESPFVSTPPYGLSGFGHAISADAPLLRAPLHC